MLLDPFAKTSGARCLTLLDSRFLTAEKTSQREREALELEEARGASTRSATGNCRVKMLDAWAAQSTNCRGFSQPPQSLSWISGHRRQSSSFCRSASLASLYPNA
ncbi:hypothetical protein CDEST_09120 [Colletotrichum destructivum]|uniref:Uncharacterized protein n=1 Tax=Colletotrichum destructivum TaxID=34406 RepID=A0AAX4ILW2_9PEZI|nr:hypothetical protein CDEST_09120 [Colletotrichum destructivum]